uniref:Uncharacterized protein n=1 Tax=Cyclopterus lumpus TaxID=8103 RepID=A0A8C2Z8W0_CYCLU
NVHHVPRPPLAWLSFPSLIGDLVSTSACLWSKDFVYFGVANRDNICVFASRQPSSPLPFLGFSEHNRVALMKMI